MLNKAFRLSVPFVFSARGRLRGRSVAAARAESSREDASVQTFLMSVWQSYSGMSVGGWGWPW